MLARHRDDHGCIGLKGAIDQVCQAPAVGLALAEAIDDEQVRPVIEHGRDPLSRF